MLLLVTVAIAGTAYVFISQFFDVFTYEVTFGSETICDDRKDNDVDGFTDCIDSDCWLEPACLNALRIIRDEWGIPYIFAETDEAAMFGVGYAMAEDRLFQMHYIRRVMQGRIAELLGNKKDGTSIERDKAMRHMGVYRQAQLRANNLDTETNALLKAFSDGVNHYIAENKDNLHPLFGGEVPENWTPADSLVAWDHTNKPSVPDSEVKNLRDFITLSGTMDPVEAAWELVPTIFIHVDQAHVLLKDVPTETLEKMKDYAALHPPWGGVVTNYSYS